MIDLALCGHCIRPTQGIACTSKLLYMYSSRRMFTTNVVAHSKGKKEKRKIFLGDWMTRHLHEHMATAADTRSHPDPYLL